MESARSPITSPIAIFEAALGICRKRHTSLEEAAEYVREFLRGGGVPYRLDHREGAGDSTSAIDLPCAGRTSTLTWLSDDLPRLVPFHSDRIRLSGSEHNTER